LRACANTAKTILLNCKVDIMLKRFTFFCVAVAIAGCSASETAAPPPAPPMAVKTAVAVAAGEMVLATLPATVVQPPGARVAVAAPFPGLVRDVAVQPGQAVRRGQVLATLISRDAMQMAAELSRAEARRRLTAAELARMEALARAGVVAGARADSAAAANAEATISVDAARRMLVQMGADRSGSVRLVAPIAGRVASMALEAGAAVDGSSAPIVIEAEGSRWLALQVPERLAGSLRAGMAVRTDDGQRGRLETIGSAIDPATRAFAARARLDDGGPMLNSGRLLRLTIAGPAPAGAVAVPAAALAAENGADLVFVKGAKGFAARPVTRAGSGDPAVIVAGLKAGEAVAIRNLPELRAGMAR
jgi:cobalt-zinc-cadmium efflux system membrane fusion protein